MDLASGAGKDVGAAAAAAAPTSKDMKGMEFGGRGRNGGVGRRCMVAASPGLPPEGKITGGTLNSFDIDRNFQRTDLPREN